MDYFPLGLASGEAFCNRIQERKLIAENIKKARPTLIMSPRRYGKTSLVLQVLKSNNFLYAHIDLFSELNKADVENSIMKGVGQIIGKITPTPSKALKVAREFFANLKIKISLEDAGVSLDFDLPKKISKSDLKDVLLRFDEFLLKYKKKAILFIDEFQRINQIVDDISIEAVLRQIAQQSKNIIFIFSGSNRHLLKQIFDDRNRPFYKLCDRIILNRILPEEYNKYINFAATKEWKKNLGNEMINSILELTQCHPYYVNFLCSRVWQNSKLPTHQDVIDSWNKLILEERSQISAEIDLLSNNQRKLLIGLAKYEKTKEPMNKLFAIEISLSTSSIRQALTVLEQKDYIFKDSNGFYQLIDPLMNAVLA